MLDSMNAARAHMRYFRWYYYRAPSRAPEIVRV
jgi:hypothetical protein